jgi:FKBP-type peptidyl-prolyl cis-trans isomerase
MKKVFSLLGVFCLVFSFTGCKKFGSSSASNAEVKTPAQQLSYCLGLDIGKSLKELKTPVDAQAFFRGVEDNLNGKKPLFADAQAEQIKREAFMKMQAERTTVNKGAEEKFFAENKTKPGVITTASGLQYIIVKEGAGPTPKSTDKVSVHYAGKLIDGTEFDSSIKRGQPATFPVSGVIPGWTEALMLMKVGSKYKVFIPSALAYGERGAPPKIEPNATLIFDVELLGIEK